MSVLIIAEHMAEHVAEQQPGQLVEKVAQLVTAAQALGGPIKVLLLGQGLTEVGQQVAALNGVANVLLADHPNLADGQLDGAAKWIASECQHYRHCLMAASAMGKRLLPQIAAHLGVEMISDVIAIESPTIFLRSIYAGSAIARVASTAPITLLTLRQCAFASAPTQVLDKVLDPARDLGSAPSCVESTTRAAAPVAQLTVPEYTRRTRLIERRAAPSGRPALTAAKVVVSGGRALGSSAQFALIDGLADKLGGAVGGTRAAVDAGLVANDLQIGQSGNIVAPALYIAVGISGAIQHLAGMKESKVIVAINHDPHAPIFQIADYGLVGDLFTLLPELTAKL
ncbi:MAG: electron transfer flavoprotein subunit alpha/FixB family protein [Aeromonas sp.]